MESLEADQEKGVPATWPPLSFLCFILPFRSYSFSSLVLHHPDHGCASTLDIGDCNLVYLIRLPAYRLWQTSCLLSPLQHAYPDAASTTRAGAGVIVSGSIFASSFILEGYRTSPQVCEAQECRPREGPSRCFPRNQVRLWYGFWLFTPRLLRAAVVRPVCCHQRQLDVSRHCDDVRYCESNCESYYGHCYSSAGAICYVSLQVSGVTRGLRYFFARDNYSSII